MYEPIRTKSVHSTVARTPASDFPHRSREEELDIQLAGHLAALLAVTDELRALEPSAELDVAAERLAGQLTRLRGASPSRAGVAADASSVSRLDALHQRAHALAGRALVVAASRADTAAAILSAERMDAHAVTPVA
ncbi:MULTISPECIES: SCO4983 family protein [unclassified Streptomyces]|uniref:SCO4983 family protein n=1 Tax=unclassified Streptomyces TaxID=2593676 RepID=UPI0036C1119E